jgi:hypothetical protein
VRDPCVDPSHGIGDISAVNRNFVPDEEILRDIFLHPFAKLGLLVNGPSAVSHLPYLKWGFIGRLTEGWSGKKDEEEENEEIHDFILKRLMANCQLGDNKVSKWGDHKVDKP